MSKRKAELFFRLSPLLETGIPIAKVFRILAESERSLRSLADVSRRLEQGQNLSQALGGISPFSTFDIRIIAAGEATGHLAEIIKYLAKYYEQIHQRTQRLIQKLIYPVFLLHAAIFIPSLPIVIQAGVEQYLTTVFSQLFVIYGTVFLIYAFYKISQSMPKLKEIVDKTLLHVPIVGSFLLKHELSRSLMIFQVFYKSGIMVTEATLNTAKMSMLLPLQKVWLRAYEQMQGGQGIAVSFANETLLPRVVRELISTGEVSGKLEQTLEKASEVMSGEADTSFFVLGKLFSGLAFSIAVCLVLIQIFSFYSSYFQKLSNF